MNTARLLEVARLRSIIQRIVRQHGQDEALAMLRRVIESELLSKPKYNHEDTQTKVLLPGNESH